MKIYDDITIGRCSRIGGNTVVVKPVPPESMVVGVPGEVVKRKSEGRRPDVPDLEHSKLPDVLGDALVSLMRRMDSLEARVAVDIDAAQNGAPGESARERSAEEYTPHIPHQGVWRGEDFDV